MEFESFKKIPRLSRDIVITEKIDGTNAQIFIADDFQTMLVGSRTRWITPQDDNYGFANWAEKNKEELLKLGPGRHFGEWWGSGIQRGYGLKEKKFSLFNTGVWTKENIPVCCDVVPVLYSGKFDTNLIENVLFELARNGSVASPGFMKPEGIIIYHSGSQSYFKKTIEKDEGKGE